MYYRYIFSVRELTFHSLMTLRIEILLSATQDGTVRTTQDWSSHCVRGEVSLSCISRLIFVAQGTGKFPSEEEMRDARQNLRLAKPGAGGAAAGPTQQSPQGALVRVPC